MKKNHLIKVLVTEEQKAQIKRTALMYGYLTLSGYLRAVALNQDTNFLLKFNRLYDRLMEPNDDKKE